MTLISSIWLDERANDFGFIIDKYRNFKNFHLKTNEIKLLNEKKPSTIYREMLEETRECFLNSSHDHLLLLSPEKMITPLSLKNMISRNKEVVVAGGSGGSGLVYFQEKNRLHCGLHCCLIKREVVEKNDFNASTISDFFAPEKIWFKKVLLNGVEVWVDYEIKTYNSIEERV